MSDEQIPPPAPSDPPAAAPPPPPADPPPEPPAGASGDNAAENPNRTVYLWLSYAWILALFPFLLEKDDAEVKWHAKHGLVLTGAELLLQVAMGIVGSIGPLGCLGCSVGLVIWLAFLVFRIMAAVKATQGGRMTIPGLSDLADKF